MTVPTGSKAYATLVDCSQRKRNSREVDQKRFYCHGEYKFWTSIRLGNNKYAIKIIVF